VEALTAGGVTWFEPARGSFSHALGLDKKDLPYWLVVDSSTHKVILAGRLSPILSEQKLQVESLTALHSM
jgi:hypothetical protein